MTRDTILRKVQALLNLGDKDKNTSEAEAAAAMEKAHELLRKHNMEMSDVEVKQETEDQITESTPDFTRTYQWVWDICVGIDYLCSTYHCRFRGSGKRGWSYRMVFCGTQTDVTTATVLFNYLYHTVQQMGKDAKLPGIKERNSYCNGVGRRIMERAWEIKKDRETPEEERCTAIMVLKGQLAEQHMRQKWSIKSIRPNTSNGDVLAFLLGQRDGDKVPLNIRSTLPEGK